MITEVRVELSTGNVFADLGYDDPEEMSDKAEIVRSISKTITQLQIDHAKVAEIIGIKQSEVYDLIIGRLLRLPKDQLSLFLTKLTTMNSSKHPNAQGILKLQEIVENGILSGEWTFDHENKGSTWDGYFSTKGIAKNVSWHFSVDISFMDGCSCNTASLIWKQNDDLLLKAYHYEQDDSEDNEIDIEAQELIKTCLEKWITAKEERVSIIQNNLLSNPIDLQVQTQLEKTEKEDFQPCFNLIKEWILDPKAKYFLEKDLEALKVIYGNGELNRPFVHNTLSIIKKVFKYIILSSQDKSIDTLQEIEESNNEFQSIENLDEWNFDQLVQTLLDFNILDDFTVPISKVIYLYGQSETEEIDANIVAIVASGLNIICRTIMR
jgi:predicted XRE-type DNA-binding protein